MLFPQPAQEKPCILILVEWFVPGYRAGGPIQSCVNLIRALKPFYTFRVITMNHDHRHYEPYPDIVPDIWLPFEEGVDVYYFSEKAFSAFSLNKLLRTTDCNYVYLNVFFSDKFTLLPLLLHRLNPFPVPVVVAPRGNLSTGAISIKTLKKKTFLTVSRLVGLYRNIRFHATTAYEKSDIEANVGSVPITVLPNFPEQKQGEWSPLPKRTGEIRLVYIARISPEKNLKLILSVLPQLTGKVIFDIYGPRENAVYWQECEALIKKLPDTCTVAYRGAVLHEQVQATLSQYHFFAQPSLGENFGHSIFEALLCGKPLIISDKTPWRNLEAEQLGWDISLAQPDSYAVALQQAIEMDQDQYNQWSATCWQFAQRYRTNPDLIQSAISLFSPIVPTL